MFAKPLTSSNLRFFVLFSRLSQILKTQSLPSFQSYLGQEFLSLIKEQKLLYLVPLLSALLVYVVVIVSSFFRILINGSGFITEIRELVFRNRARPVEAATAANSIMPQMSWNSKHF